MTPAAHSPKVVIFDLGKVLVDFDYGISAAKISAKANVSPAEVRALIDHSPLLFRYETGLIEKLEFFREVCKLTGYRGTQEEFEPEFADIFSPIHPMISAQARLRKEGVPTFILSNTNDMAAGHIRRTFPFFANFDGYVFSFERKVMKPDMEIYEVAEKITGFQGADIVYIDDREENVRPGQKRGWNVIHHRAPEGTIARLRTLGLL